MASRYDDKNQHQKIHQAVVSRNDSQVSEVYANEFDPVGMFEVNL